MRRLSILVAWLLLLSCAQAEMISLRAGPVTMEFDSELAFLRYIRINDHEILRGINAPVRDQFWGTVLPRVSNLKLNDEGDQFTLSFDALCKERDIDFLWHGKITGTSRGEVEFTFDGQAKTSFLRNRVGFCVLHGPDAAGQQWNIEHSNGTRDEGRFPKFISPHQPAKSIRAIAHEVVSDVWAHVRFEGEVFEMEDQRNWTDASFKTYCTPLEIPYPVRVAKGAKISQQVRIKLTGDVEKLGQAPREGKEIVLTIADPAKSTNTLPRIGLQVSSQTSTLSAAEVDRLKSLNLDHLRVDLTPAVDSVADKLRQATRQARALGVNLHVGLHLGERPELELDQLATQLDTLHPPVSLWLVISADGQAFDLAKQKLSPHDRKAQFGIGEDTNFTELNRNRPDVAKLDVISYGINPQIHAVDNASIIETLPIQGDSVRSAMQFAGGRPLAITPITLRPQQVSQDPLPGELPSNVDVRQLSPFNAGWTIGSVKSLAEAGAQFVTYFETVGWKGIMESSEGSANSQLFPSKPGQIFPVFVVLKTIGEFAGGVVRHIESSDSLSVVGLVLEKANQRCVLATNLTDQEQVITMRGLASSIVLHELDDASDPIAWRPLDGIVVEDKGLRLRISPFAILKIEHALR